MLVVATVVRIRREHAGGKTIARGLGLSREVVRKAGYPHPVQNEMTVAEALELEQPVLQPMLAPFDGFHRTQHAVTCTCLISFERKRYSVAARAVRRAVQVRAYADRIVVRMGDEVVAEHPRFFGRDRTMYDTWHYLPVLVAKPGALKNGTSFQGWELPSALARLRRKLGSGDKGDRRYVTVLAAVLSDGLEAIEAAVREALDTGSASDEVILNILSRRREPPRLACIVTLEDLALMHPPVANCARYNSLRDMRLAAMLHPVGASPTRTPGLASRTFCGSSPTGGTR